MASAGLLPDHHKHRKLKAQLLKILAVAAAIIATILTLFHFNSISTHTIGSPKKRTQKTVLVFNSWKTKELPDSSGLHTNGFLKQGIPTIIHQSWKTKELPARFRNMSSTFIEHNPAFQYKLWTDEDNENLMEHHYPWFKSTWNKFSRNIYRVDAVRAMYLHRYGGLYFDLDFWCLRPLERLVANLSGVVLGYMSDNHAYEHSVPNAFMASEPGQPFWLFFLSHIAKITPAKKQFLGIKIGDDDGPGPEAVTGPVALFNAVREWKQLCKQEGLPDNITIMDRPTWYLNDWNKQGWSVTEEEPQKYCAPAHFDYDRCAASFPDTYTVTLWTHSWEDHPWASPTPLQ